MERAETQQAEAEREPASTTGQAAAANNRRGQGATVRTSYQQQARQMLMPAIADAKYNGCERAPSGLSTYQHARQMLMPAADADAEYSGCERAPTGLSIYQQARQMLMPDGEQGPSYRNAAQDQNQRRAPAAPAKNIKQEEEQAKEEANAFYRTGPVVTRRETPADFGHGAAMMTSDASQSQSQTQIWKEYKTSMENIRQEEEQAADSRLVTSFQNLRTKREERKETKRGAARENTYEEEVFPGGGFPTGTPASSNASYNSSYCSEESEDGFISTEQRIVNTEQRENVRQMVKDPEQRRLWREEMKRCQKDNNDKVFSWFNDKFWRKLGLPEEEPVRFPTSSLKTKGNSRDRDDAHTTQEDQEK